MKKFLLFLALAAAMWQPAAAGELTFGWNLINSTGAIYDMEFMPDNNYFVFADYKSLQVRSTETGELVHNYTLPELFAAHDIEFTPDNTRMILAYGDNLELRNVSDMSIIKNYKIPDGTDTAGYDISESNLRFYEIVVDPIRPYVYAIRNRSGTLSGGKYFVIRRIVIINYETMEDVGILSLNEEDNTLFEKIAISKDGKYLAVNNQGLSRIWVWSLETQKKIREYPLYPNGATSKEIWGEPTCTKFSELNTDLVYFSGSFPQSKDYVGHSGIFQYNIHENRIIDSTFGVGIMKAGYSYFTIFDLEKRVINLNGNKINIMNLFQKIIEKSILQDTINNGVRSWSKKIIYSDFNKMFIGFSQKSFSSAKNNIETAIYDEIKFDSIIYPNPSSGIVSLQTNCQNSEQFYNILDINGTMLIPDTRISFQMGMTAINISNLPNGTYFLRYYCGSTVTTYKVVKEG
jgi:WD40 repeat protein